MGEIMNVLSVGDLKMLSVFEGWKYWENLYIGQMEDHYTTYGILGERTPDIL